MVQERIVVTVSLRRDSRFAAVLVLGTIAASALPVMFSLNAGAAPYEAIGRAHPGSAIAVLAAAFQVLTNLAATVTIGGVLWRVLTQPRSRRAPRVPEGPGDRIVSIAATTWAVAALPYAVFSALDTAGIPFEQIAAPGGLAYAISSVYAPGALLIHLFGAAIVFLIVQFTRSWQWQVAALWFAAWAVVAPVAVGHVLVGPNHDLASDVAYFQVLAQNAGFGLVLFTAAMMALGHYPTPAALRRLYPTVVVLVLLTLAPEGLIAWFKLAGTPLTGSRTGALMLARWVSAAVLLGGLLGGAYLARRAKASAALLTAVTAIAGLGALGWLALTATMVREPPPQYFVPTTISQVFMGYDVEAPVSWRVWFTHWRPNLFFLILAVAAISLYLYGTRRLSRRGDPWPIGRTVAWCLGWGIAAFITSSGFGKYSAPDFATHMFVHMTLNMLVPVFLVLGGAVTLALRASAPATGGFAGVHAWLTWMLNWRVLRVLYHPLLVFAFFIISYYGLYLSSLFGNLMPFHWGHQLMNVHFLIIGVMFYSLVIGVDPTPRQLPHIGKLGYIVAAMPFHAFFGIVLMTSRYIIGEDFYRRIDLPWADLATSQYVGGGITWAGGELPLLVVVIALGIQWAKQDAREARRKDRHFDTGLDQEFEAYNAMLEKLAAREARTPAVAASTPEESHD